MEEALLAEGRDNSWLREDGWPQREGVPGRGNGICTD